MNHKFDMSKTFKILILILIIGGMFGIGLAWKEVQKSTEISATEKQKIETWILENDLNQYGDSKNMFYTGGTPLFNEKTGERIDKYEYILRNYPDRPWLK